MSCNKSGEENFLNFLFIVIPLLLVEPGVQWLFSEIEVNYWHEDGTFIVFFYYYIYLGWTSFKYWWSIILCWIAAGAGKDFTIITGKRIHASGNIPTKEIIKRSDVEPQ